MEDHKNFWRDLAGRTGAPVLSATLVGCLLSSRFEATHAILLGVGLFLVYLDHRSVYHRTRR